MANTNLLVQRVIGLLRQPRRTLEEDGTPPPPPAIMVMEHLLPLLVVTGAVLLVFSLLFPPTTIDEMPPPSFFELLWRQVTRIVLVLVIVAATGAVIQWFAGVFGGLEDFSTAFTAAGLAATPILVVPVIAVLPSIGPLAALAAMIYSAVLLFWALEIIVQVPQDRRGLFCAAVIVAVIVVTGLLTMIFSNVLMM